MGGEACAGSSVRLRRSAESNGPGSCLPCGSGVACALTGAACGLETTLVESGGRFEARAAGPRAGDESRRGDDSRGPGPNRGDDERGDCDAGMRLMRCLGLALARRSRRALPKPRPKTPAQKSPKFLDATTGGRLRLPPVGKERLLFTSPSCLCRSKGATTGVVLADSPGRDKPAERCCLRRVSPQAACASCCPRCSWCAAVCSYRPSHGRNCAAVGSSISWTQSPMNRWRTRR